MGSLAVKSTLNRNQAPQPRENDELPEVPYIRRRSLPAGERQGSTNRPIEADDLEGGLPRTDDLRKERVTNPPQGMMVRTRRSSCSIQQEPKHVGWMKIALLGVIAVLACWGLIGGFLSVVSWFTDVSNTYTYGPTRTSVVSGVFGINNDSLAHQTSIIAVNLRGTLVIESIPANDVSRIKSYPTGFAMVGDTVGKLPIHLTMVHLTRNKIKDTRLDVQVEIPSQNITLDLINTGNDFVLITPTK